MLSNLYIQTAFLGDLCLAVPALQRLRALRPHQPLILVCRKGLGSLFLELGLVDQYFEIEKGNRKSYQDVLDKISSVEFDWVICPHQSFTSAWFQKSLNAKHKISYKQWWNKVFFTKTLKKPEHFPEAIRQMYLLTEMDHELKGLIEGANYALKDNAFLSSVPSWASPVISGLLNQPRLKKCEEIYSLQTRRVVFFPGSVWETKKWTETGFIAVANQLEILGYQVVFMGTAQEQELCERIRLATKNGLNLAGQTSLSDSLYVLARASLVICNDSGGQHLASLAGVAILSIFGPTVLTQGFRPWSSNAMVAEIEGLSCRPCGRHGHQVCPIGTHECMKRLSAQTVGQMAMQLLTRYSPSR